MWYQKCDILATEMNRNLREIEVFTSPTKGHTLKHEWLSIIKIVQISYWPNCADTMLTKVNLISKYHILDTLNNIRVTSEFYLMNPSIR